MALASATSFYPPLQGPITRELRTRAHRKKPILVNGFWALSKNHGLRRSKVPISLIGKKPVTLSMDFNKKEALREVLVEASATNSGGASHWFQKVQF
ncbi:hypothetical protein AMTR_s00048p00138280 [Amborella trichopoda]|uniref:Uncharacterized protein n=1 Tax=Amborella trichopoda TaxID=13333 RepID=U5CQV4_AMBTC|nr:hypothetical protein AMTR_s00048p00138280 [Amborella trichopoda]